MLLTEYLYLNTLSGGLTNVEVNMPFRLTSAIGGLSAGTTYFVASTGSVTTNVTNSNAGTEELTCASTTGFYVGMPITFSGGVFGGVVENTTYYVKTIASSIKFTMSATAGGSTFNLTGDNGLMTLTSNNPFITVSSTVGGSTLPLTDNFSAVTTLTQYPTSTPTFYISYALGGYSVFIHTAGSGFTSG